MIEHCVEGDDGHAERFCLLTTLLDPTCAPACELAELYAQRWELETAVKELQVGQRGAGVVLRSHHPEGLAQEIWSMRCVCQALRDLITQAADRAGIDPDRISFKSALGRRPPLGRDGSFPPGGSSWRVSTCSPTSPAGPSADAKDGPAPVRCNGAHPAAPPAEAINPRSATSAATSSCTSSPPRSMEAKAASLRSTPVAAA